MNLYQRSINKLLGTGLLTLLINHAFAGPIVIDGTDANDHGSASSSANLGGWFYMQRVLENLASGLDPSVPKALVNLGANPGTQAGNAIASAFNFSSLAGTGGWTLVNVNGASDITDFLSTLSTATTGIIYIPTYSNNNANGSGAPGDLEPTELAEINAQANAINNFLAGAGGGGLYSQAETGPGAYGWLTALLPGLIVNTCLPEPGCRNMQLTPDGRAAFPGLSDTDLSTGPWHNYFSGDFGNLSMLALGDTPQGARVPGILGGSADTVLACGLAGQPPCSTAIPEPGALQLLALGLVGLFTAVRRRFN